MTINRTGPGEYIDTATGRTISGAANPAAAAARFQAMTAKGTNIAADNRTTPAPTPGGNGGASPQKPAPMTNQMPVNTAPPQNMGNLQAPPPMPMASTGGGQTPAGLSQYGSNYALNSGLGNTEANTNAAINQLNGAGGGQLGVSNPMMQNPAVAQPAATPQMTAANIAQNMYGGQAVNSPAQGINMSANTNKYL